MVKFCHFFETLKRRHIRSYDSANCSFDAVDFTVELNPFGAQVDEIIMRSSFGGFLKWGYPKLDGLKKRDNPTKMDDLEVPFQETTSM